MSAELSKTRSFSTKIGFSNNTDRLRVIWVEPWGGDFTLLPGEELEIIARDPEALPWFNVVEHGKGTQVYIETADPIRTDFEVFQGGKPIVAGHNHQAALDAGIEM